MTVLGSVEIDEAESESCDAEEHPRRAGGLQQHTITTADQVQLSLKKVPSGNRAKSCCLSRENDSETQLSEGSVRKGKTQPLMSCHVVEQMGRTTNNTVMNLDTDRNGFCDIILGRSFLQL